MAKRKSKARKIIEDYVAGKNRKPYALGPGFVFISPAEDGYYLHVKMTPPKGKAYWVGAPCKGIRFSEDDKCRHTIDFDAQLDEAVEILWQDSDEQRKEMLSAITSGRKARTKKKK